MHLKIEYLGREKSYSFQDKDSIIIGRSPSCDIQLVLEGISRKHLMVFKREQKIFAQDLGSTNGSYINSDKLAPGKERAFNSLFPVQLGKNVFLHIEGEEEEQESTTDVFSNPAVKDRQDFTQTKQYHSELNDFGSYGSDDEEESNQESEIKRPNMDLINQTIRTAERKENIFKEEESKVKKASVKSVAILTVVSLVFLSTLYYILNHETIDFEERTFNTAANPQYNESSIQDNLKQMEMEKLVNELQKDQIEISKEIENIDFILKGDRCLNDTEKKFCKLFFLDRQKNDFTEGASINNGVLYLVINAKNHLPIFVDKMGYTEDEKKLLISHVSHKYGRRKNLNEIRRTLIVDSLSEIESGRLVAFYELFRTDYKKIIEEVGYIKYIMPVVYVPKQEKISYLGHIKFSKDFYLNIDFEEYVIPLKFAGLSGETDKMREKIKFFSMKILTQEEIQTLEQKNKNNAPKK